MTDDEFGSIHPYVVCKKCNWVSFSVSNKYIDKWEADWKVYWATLEEEGREAFGLKHAPPDQSVYDSCHRCGGSFRNFRPFADTDKFPTGSTINPIREK